MKFGTSGADRFASTIYCIKVHYLLASSKLYEDSDQTELLTPFHCYCSMCAGHP